jgi:hypothetical protein
LKVDTALPFVVPPSGRNRLARKSPPPCRGSYDTIRRTAPKLWIQPLDGGEPKLLPEFKTDRIFGFDWSRDGKYMACVRGLWAANVVLIIDFR